MKQDNTTPNDSPAFLGTGWAFPPRFSTAQGGAEMVSGTQDIRQSLEILLGTAQGERIMREDFGCNVRGTLFGTQDTSTETYLRDLVETAILYYEPRITLDNLQLERGNALAGELMIRVEYTIKSTNTRTNQVFPFYLTEGTNLSP